MTESQVVIEVRANVTTRLLQDIEAGRTAHLCVERGLGRIRVGCVVWSHHTRIVHERGTCHAPECIVRGVIVVR